MLGAQAFFGGVTGTVTDASGAAVPNATVTVTNLGTRESHTVKTDSRGLYRFVNLVPASYEVQVESVNFKRFLRTPIEIQVGDSTRLDAALEVGAATETVEVTTEIPMLQVDSGQVTQHVEGETVQQMPLNGRNTMNLISLTAGVVPQGAASGSTAANQNSGNTSNVGWGNYQIGGGIAGQSSEYVDGAAINVIGNTVAYVPTQDAVQEFSVASNSVSADFGRFSGGVVNLTTKSGTNAFHGTIYEYLRNTAFNANDWFNKRSQFTAGSANTPLKFDENQYGVQASGPIWRNKAFFMFSWENSTIRFAQYSPTNIPTSGMTSGQVPYVAAASGVTTGVTDGSGHQIVKVTDPLGRCAPVQNNAGNYWDISACSFAASSKQMVQYYPPLSGSSYGYNGAGLPYGVFGTSSYNDPATVGIGTDQRQYNGRVDYNVSDKQRIFARYSTWNLGDISFNQFPTVTKYNVGNGSTQNNTNIVVFGDTYTLNPTTVVDFRASWTRQHYDTIKPQRNVDETQFFPGASFTSQELTGLPPTFGLNSQRSLFTSFSRGAGSLTALTNDQISANVVKILGHHSFKVGTELRLMIGTNTGVPTSGAFTFNGNYTGDEWSDFLLGYAKSGTIVVPNPVTAWTHYQAYYAQDNWQFSKNLTFNFGVRWDIPGSIGEANDKLAELLPNTVDPYTGITGTLGLVNSSLYAPRTIQDSTYSRFAPRVGFADRLSNNTVLRGGFGLVYLPPDLFFSAAGPNSSSINSATTPLTNTAPLTPANVANGNFILMSNPFPNGLITPSGRSNPAFLSKPANPLAPNRLFTSAIAGPAPHPVFPYNEQWNLSVSQVLPGDLLLDLGYVGSKGTHLPAISGGLDQLPKSAWNNAWVPNPSNPSGPYVNDNTIADCVLTTPMGGYTKTVTRGQCRQPYPYYSNFSDTNPYWASSNYNSLQMRVQKRFKSGGLIMATYTWAKLIGDTESLSTSVEPKATNASNASGYGYIEDNNNHRGERSVLSFSVPNRAVISYVLPLPFGHGRAFLSNANGWIDRLAGGWALNGITTFQSGFALALTESASYPLTATYGAGTMRPDYIAGCNKFVPGSTRQRLTKWFNTACFQAPGTSLGTPTGAAAGTLYWALGNEPRVDNAIHSEGIDNWDISAVKSTQIYERYNLEFRGEFFNVMNRTQFAPPVLARGSAQFGTIQLQTNQPRLIQLSLRLNF